MPGGEFAVLDVMLARLQELTVLLYAVSVLLYFIDFLYNNRKANKLAFRMLTIVWLFQTIFLFLYVLKTDRFPVLTLFEGLYFYVWVLVTLSVYVSKFLKFDFIIFFTNILGFIMMVIHTFSPFEVGSANDVLVQQLASELLFAHITIAFLAYGAFTFSFILALLYLLQYDLLKKKRWGKRLRRLGDLAGLEKTAHFSNVIGVSLLFFSLVLGLGWAHIKIPGIFWLDAKILGSFFALLIYAAIIFIKVKKQVYGKTIAYWNIGAFLIVLVNFFLFDSLSTFHFWYA